MNNPKISQNFTYAEVIKSNVAVKLQMDNSVPDELLPKIKLVADNILEKVRENFGKPIAINSWYRCQALNQIISNNPNSQHTKGEAVDFIVTGISNMIIAEYIRDNLDFDQLILERSWIHCSYVANGNRKNVLRTIDGRIYENGLSD
jgi:hypothetical protein